MPKGWKPPSSSYPEEPSYGTPPKSSNSQISTLEEAQIFISYAREDEPLAMRLYNDLKSAGLNPWIDRKRILPVQDWQKEIQNAIRNSQYFIPLFSSISVNKIGFVQNEFKFGLDTLHKNEDIEEFLPYYIPVRLNDCQVPSEELRNIRVVDLFPYERNWNEGVEMIVQRIADDIDVRNNMDKDAHIAAELFDQDKYDEAIEYLNRALESAPHDLYKLALIRGKAVFLNGLERYDEVIEFIDITLKDVGTVKRSWTLWLEKGNALYSLERYHEAIECYDRILELEIDDGETWYKKGLALIAIGKSYTANQCFDKAKQLGYSEE